MPSNPVANLRETVEREFRARPQPQPPSDTLRECRRALFGVVGLSAVINLLYLTSSFFMLEVYDRVIPSRSVPTLLALCTIAFVLYGFQAALDSIRSRIFVRIGKLADARLSSSAFRAGLELTVAQRKTDPRQPLRDLDQLRQFFWSGGPVGFLDVPWIPAYLLICFAFHPLLGFAAVAGALVLGALTLLTDRGARQASRISNEQAALRTQMDEAIRRNAETVQALGMREAMTARWQAVNRDYLRASGEVSDVVGGYGAFSKVFRTALQSMILALGAWLVIQQQATGGIMIASSILVSRALAPVEGVIAHWKGFLAARAAWKRLATQLAERPAVPMDLPRPCRRLAVERLTLIPPGSQASNLSDISFTLEGGTALGVIGRSASGKSSLARALVGIWRPARGAVRLDGAALDQWDTETLGGFIGYMPQESELFAGTISENIARFDPEMSPTAVLAAAQAAGVHDLILRLPNGYDTQIGDRGNALSAGQRQLVALARALYRDPFLVVLDEPNSNLDHEGDLSLKNAIESIKERGAIAVVIAHRPAAITSCDLLLMLAGGKQHLFGKRDDVLAAATNRAPPPPIAGDRPQRVAG